MGMLLSEYFNQVEKSFSTACSKLIVLLCAKDLSFVKSAESKGVYRHMLEDKSPSLVCLTVKKSIYEME